MKTTPIFGFEYAEGGDPAKQYPAAVDGPSKLKIEQALSAVIPHVRGRRTTDLSVAAGATKVTGLTLDQNIGGIIYDGTKFTIPQAGVYAFTSYAQINGSEAHSYIRINGTTDIAFGSRGAPSAASVSRSVAADVSMIPAGATVEWYISSVAAGVLIGGWANIGITYQGRSV